jgi:hypothetical protein
VFVHKGFWEFCILEEWVEDGLTAAAAGGSNKMATQFGRKLACELIFSHFGESVQVLGFSGLNFVG